LAISITAIFFFIGLLGYCKDNKDRNKIARVHDMPADASNNSSGF
jgi:hypothetical protein